MSAETSLFYLTQEEYLKLELNSDIRHEYQEYVLVSEKQIKVEIYRKNSLNNWNLEILTESNIAFSD